MRLAVERIEISGAAATVYRDAPAWENRRCAALGSIVFESAEAGRALLASLRKTLAAEGFDALLGPMDGDTWHSYRLVSQSDGSPSFMLEPRSGPHDHAVFMAAGFTPVSEYVSARARLADTLGDAAVTMPDVEVTAWDGREAETLIAKLFAMSGSAFAGNRFFKPITLDAFLALYRPILPLLDPRHVLFAHATNGELVGFLLGMPDRLDQTGKPAAILKTYASARRGVGHLLGDAYHRRAIEMGHDTVIHALMHVDNISRERSGRHHAEVFRRYSLMALPLNSR